MTVHADLQAELARLEKLSLLPEQASSGRDDRLLTIVPAYASPETEDVQRLRFEKQINEQLRKADVKPKTLKFQGRGRTLRETSLKALTLQCAGSGKMDKALNLLAELPENPYLLSIETFQFECDENDPQKVELTMAFSTLCQ